MKINNKMALCIAFLCSVFFSGCVLKFQDVSNDPEYLSLLHARYSLSTNMLICGVNLPPGYRKKVDIYIINPMWPKVVGREIVTEYVLKSGTTLDVKSVQKSTNHLPGYQSIQAVVELNNFTKAVDVPVVINLKYIQSTNYMEPRRASQGQTY